MNQLTPDSGTFLRKYHLPADSLARIGIGWDELAAIHNDHQARTHDLEAAAALISSILQRLPETHSLHFRIKDPEHLVAKIIRKMTIAPNRIISFENYTSEITDLIGIRALHLFKRDWAAIHRFVTRKWNLAEIPTAYIRAGDPQEIIREYEHLGCGVKPHPMGYRSVHYLAQCTPAQDVLVAEIQVRSLFEEGWSEIDHRVRYPADNVSPLLRQHLVVFNRLAGSADEMGSFAMLMKEHMEEQARDHRDELDKLEQRYEQLRLTATGGGFEAEYWGLEQRPTSLLSSAVPARSTIMEPISIKDAANILTARVVGVPKWTATSVTIDSRTAIQNNLFFALEGQITDGHEHVAEAFAKGAAGAVVSREIRDAGTPQLVVPDTKLALGQLGRYYRDQFDIPVVGVTGSIGKTSTKEMLACALARRYSVLANEKNYNTEIGVPLTLFGLDRTHEVAVIEMGMRGGGQIRQLTEIARPTIGLITNIGLSHIEHLGSRDRIAETKGELIDALGASGVAVLNRDDDYFDYLRSRCKCRYVTFGIHPEADFRVSDLRYSSQGRPIFKVNGVDFNLLATGVHHPMNAAAVCAVADLLKTGLEDVAEGLERFTPPPMRGNVLGTPSGTMVLNDSYNAAPDSMTSGLRTLVVVAGSLKRRPVAVLGDMLELGDHSIPAHRFVGGLVRDLGVELLVTIGPGAEEIGTSSGLPLGEKLFAYPNAESASATICNLIREEDLVLIKGSREVRLDLVVEALGATEIQWKGRRAR